MPIQWTISHPNRLVVAVCKDMVSRTDIEDYLDNVVVTDTLPYRKIFDMTHGVISLSDDDVMSWFVFVVRFNDLFEPGERDAVMRELRAEGIGCNNYFPPIHLQPYLAEPLGHKPGDFPVTEYVSARTLGLPFFSRMTTSQVHRVCDVLEKVLDKTLTRGKGRF